VQLLQHRASFVEPVLALDADALRIHALLQDGSRIHGSRDLLEFDPFLVRPVQPFAHLATHGLFATTRPDAQQDIGIEGKGAIKQRQLVINALRMRPDRIVVGEVRGEEAVDMMQAMNTGHEGSLTTIHANSARDALSRLETMFSMANLNIPDRAIRYQIASAINVIVQISRLADGTRKVIGISELTGMEGPIVTMQDLFLFHKQGFDENKKVRGYFAPTGIRPKFTDKLYAAGITLPSELFNPDKSRVAI